MIDLNLEQKENFKRQVKNTISLDETNCFYTNDIHKLHDFLGTFERLTDANEEESKDFYLKTAIEYASIFRKNFVLNV